MSTDLDITAYGSYAELSAVADYVEVAALQSGRVSIVGLETTFEDIQDWPKSKMEYATLGQKQDSASDAATSVFSILAQRAAVLQVQYPFEVSASEIRPRFAVDRAYLAYLAIAFLHGNKLQANALPTKVFEHMVRRSLRSRVTKTAAIYDGHGRFMKRLRRAARRIGLSGTVRPIQHRRAANDEGCDVLVHHDLADPRPLSWVAVGQATCGSSDNWIHKAAEASPSYFRHALALYTLPVPFFAVPYHIDDSALEWLCSRRENVYVLDRLRLTRLMWRRQIVNEPATLIDDLLRVEITLAYKLSV